MRPLMLSLLVLGLMLSPPFEVGYARSGRIVLWDTGADITLLKQYLEKNLGKNYQIQPFDLLPAIDTQGPVQLASQLVKVDYVVTTATQLRRLLDKVTAPEKAVIHLADVPSIVHVLLREPSHGQRSCGLQGADIRCLSRRGSDFLTAHGSSASAAAVLTTVLPDLGPNCETGSKCKQVATLDQDREFADFLTLGDSRSISASPHVVVYVSQIRRDSSIMHTAALPEVAMLALESVSTAMKAYGLYPVTIRAKTYGDGQTSPLSTVQDITVLVKFRTELSSNDGTQIVDKRELRAQSTGGGTSGGRRSGSDRPGGDRPDQSDQNSVSLVARLGDLVPKEVRRVMLQHLLDLQYSSGKRIELDNALFEFLRQN